MVKIFTMPRLTVTLTEEQTELIDDLSGDGELYESKSEAVRSLIQAGERVEELEQTVERLEREKRQLLEQRDEHHELVRYVEEEQTWRSAPVWVRAKWWLMGQPSES